MLEPTEQHNSTERTDRSTRGEKYFISTLTAYGKTILITLLAALVLKLFVIDAYRIPSTSMEQTLQIGDFLLVNKLAYGLRTPRHIPFTTISFSPFALPLFRSVHRGDVIVFEFPGNKNEVIPSESVYYIKRCIGLPGDTVAIRSGNVLVNGIEVSFPLHGIRPSHPSEKTMRRNAELFPSGSAFSDINYGPIVVPKRGDTLKIDLSSLSRWKIFIEREGHTLQLNHDTILIDGIVCSTYCVQKNYYFVLGDNRDNSIDSRYWGFVPGDHLVGEALCIYWSWDPEIPVYSLTEKFSTIRWDRVGILIR